MYLKIKRRVYYIIDAELDDIPSKIFNIFLIALIFLNVLAIILNSIQILSLRYSNIFYVFEVISVIIFSIEYILRLWTCNVDIPYKGRLKGRVKYFFSPLALIDLVAILPFYIPMIIPIDLRFLRVIRLVRIFRILKFGRYSTSLQMLGRVLRKKKSELIVTFFVVFLLLIIASSLIYEFEREAQPEKFSSIPGSMWWAVVTLTTVGYGDIYPITIMGKILSSFIALLGIGLFALPAGILSAGMVEEMQKKKEKNETNDLTVLEKLAELKDRGIITEEEFNAKKRQILGL
jgi:voltage-gated potassium channel